MEWQDNYLSEKTNNELINFFFEREYLIYEPLTHNFLDKSNWSMWLDNVVFLKKNSFV
jgi:hypothetical protein